MIPCLGSPCDCLTMLKLADCVFELPQGFRGFINLKTVHLSRVRIDYYTLNGVILNCPMLEDLALVGCYNLVLSTTNSKMKRFALAGCDLCREVGPFLSQLAHLQILIICHLRIKVKFFFSSLPFFLGPFAYFALIFLER